MRNCIRVAMEAYRRVCRRRCSGTGASSSSTSSETSQRSKSTAPTIYSDHRPTSEQREPVDPEDNDDDKVEEEVEVEVEEDDDDEDDRHAVDPKDSASTYASTVPSSEEEEDIPEEEPRYQVFDRRPELLPPDALASNPRIFADLFPSSRRLLIRHDDTTLDGNMNLRVDTVVPHRYGYLQDVTLFHLRMYDLFSRKFSFRRYCRESGREVCHTERKKASLGFDRRLSRSWSTALASIRAGSSGGSPERNGETSPLEDGDVDAHDQPSTAFTDTTMLEFSNYAHVEVKRGMSRNYEYEYWSTKYQWRREYRTDMGLQQISYHLVDLQTSKAVAHLVPVILTPVEAVEEESKGGWVAPSSLWISDTSVYEKMSDVAE